MEFPDQIESLSAAIINGSLDDVRAVVDHSPRVVQSFTKRKQSPLMLACMTGIGEIVAFLLEAGADPNYQLPSCHVCPLHISASNGYAEIVELLLEHGADPSVLDNRGLSAKAMARQVPLACLDDDPTEIDRCSRADDRIIAMRNDCINILESN